MFKVICTIVVVLGTGERKVLQAEGRVVRESRDNVLVDFGTDFGVGQAHAQWVNENSCLYLGNPEAEMQEYLKLKELEDKKAQEDRDAWAAYHKKLVDKKKPAAGK